MKYIDQFLNNITMYRLLLYGLIALAVVSIILSFLNLLAFNFLSLIGSVMLLIIVCFGSNYILSKIFGAVINIESSFITALILFFIISPPSNLLDFTTIALIGFIAMISKYIFAINKKHLFNPVAIALVVIGFIGGGTSIWWIASINLLPFVLVLGILLIRKIKRFTLFLSFLITGALSISFFGLLNNLNPMETFIQSFTSWPLIFFGTIMLTEPQTTPPTKKLQLIYGLMIGILFGSQFQIGRLYSTPELALVLGNIFVFIVSPKQKLFLKLKEKIKISDNAYEFTFDKENNFNYKAGQYMEWTIPQLITDGRGNRRYFTIASSPTENELKLGIRFNVPSSSFKNFLLKMERGEKIVASNLSGNFVLPKDKNKKIVFIAGGIGITPFRSMIKYLTDKKEDRKIILFYACKTTDEIAYKKLLEEFEKNVSLKIFYLISDGPFFKNSNIVNGRLNEKIITQKVADFKTSLFYLSGPELMIRSYKEILLNMGINRSNILTDYFPGF